MRSTGVTDYHAKYLAAKIKRKPPMDSFSRLLPVIYDSNIPLYPHQVAAADFIHNSPINKGMILADEMGLGKTIEAGLAISMNWNEGYKHILILSPFAELKTWRVTLLMKFGLESTIYNEAKLKRLKREKIKDPFEREGIAICTYNFAFRQYKSIQKINWDLIVVDQAHRIENIYDIKSEVGDIVRQIVWGKKCILITSNPFQSTMKRLFKIGNLADKYYFGDRRSYNYQFVSITDDIDYKDLSRRLQPIMRRVKGRRVPGFVERSRREEMPMIYRGDPKEVDFTVAMINYFINSSKFGLPNQIASLPALGLFTQMTLSPKLALGGIGIIDEGLKMIREGKNPSNFLYRQFRKDIECLNWIDDEWHRNKEKENLEVAKEKSVKRAVDRERNDLLLLREYALEIRTDSRFKELLSAISRIKNKYGRRMSKFVIYTQSKLAQKYLVFLLRDAGFKGVYYVNGKNDTHENKSIYKKFINKKSNSLLISGIEDHDKRSAVIKEFEKYGRILIATDKGMQDQTLSKCDVVINYDLPLDPYLSDLRIKRVQGYVNNKKLLIVNIVNETNEMEWWNYSKQKEVFDMFHGDYGRSDIPVGSIGVGADFSMLIFGYYMMHTTIHLVDRAFRKLQIEINDAKSQSMNNYYKKLIEKSAKKERDEGQFYLDQYQREVPGLKEALMKISLNVIGGKGSISARGSGFVKIKRKPFKMKKEELGTYSFDEIGLQKRQKFYINRGIGKKIIDTAYQKKLPTSQLKFSYSSVKPRKRSLDSIRGKSGVLNLRLVTIDGLQKEEYLMFCGVTDDGQIMTQKQCHDIMSLRAKSVGKLRVTKNITKLYNRNVELLKGQTIERDKKYIKDLSNKMDTWIEDKVLVHKKDLRLIMIQKRKLHRRWVNATTERRKNNLEMDLLEVGVFRRKKRRYIRKVRKYAGLEKEQVLKEMNEKLKYSVKSKNLFTVKWDLIR